MKLLNMRLICALTVALLSTSAVAQRATAPSPAAARSPEVVLREFYKWYIHDLSQDVDPLKADKAALRKYVTVRFIREIERNEKLPEGEGFDADYFLQTQDPLPSSDANNEADWLKSISVSKVAPKATTATAVVTFLDGYPKVKVSLVEEGGVWKIDDVKDGSGTGLAK
jgi:hypothetical protein